MYEYFSFSGKGEAATMQNSDANSLFEKHTIEEIRALEKATRCVQMLKPFHL